MRREIERKSEEKREGSAWVARRWLRGTVDGQRRVSSATLTEEERGKKDEMKRRRW